MDEVVEVGSPTDGSMRAPRPYSFGYGGTGYLFDEPGCWHLTFKRSNSEADVWLKVDP